MDHKSDVIYRILSQFMNWEGGTKVLETFRQFSEKGSNLGYDLICIEMCVYEVLSVQIFQSHQL
jgi:hypothetical protein